MNWTDEPYVKVYLRDTPTWKLIGWEGRTVLLHLLRKVDRAGSVDFQDGVEGVALLLELPEDIAQRGLDALTRKGVLVKRDHVLLLPNFVEAQKARMSDRLRQSESRARRRETILSQNVTESPSLSQNVTKPADSSQSVTRCHNLSQPVTLRIEETRIEETRIDQKNTFFPIACQSEAKQDHPSLFQNTPESHQEALLDPDPVQTAQKAPPRRKQAAKQPSEPTNGSRIWQAYADAYLAHFGVAPIRDQEANSICARIAKKMPADATEACLVASFYVGHPHELAKVSAYPIGLLLKYWSKYRTECLTATTVTYRQASGSNPSGGFLELARKREAEDRQLARPTEQRRVT